MFNCFLIFFKLFYLFLSLFFSVIILHILCLLLWAASIDGHLSSLVACHCTDLYLFNLFVYLANKLSLSLSFHVDLRDLTLGQPVGGLNIQLWARQKQ